MKNPRKAKDSVFGWDAWVRLLVPAARRFGFAAVLCVLVLLFSGCGYFVKADRFAKQLGAYVWTLGSESEASAQPGETEAEGRRRHLRNKRINQQSLMRDLDRMMLTDQPSKLTDKRIP